MDDNFNRHRRDEGQYRRRSLSPGRLYTNDQFQLQQRSRSGSLLQSDVAAFRPSSFRGDYFSPYVARPPLSPLSPLPRQPSSYSSYISSGPLSSSQHFGSSEGSSLRSCRESISSRSSLLTHASSLGHTSHYSAHSAVPTQGQAGASSQGHEELDTRPTCSNCSTRETPLWRRDGKGGLFCKCAHLLTASSRLSWRLIQPIAE